MKSIVDLINFALGVSKSAAWSPPGNIIHCLFGFAIFAKKRACASVSAQGIKLCLEQQCGQRKSPRHQEHSIDAVDSNRP